MTVQPPTPFPAAAALTELVSFDRRALGLILAVYGRGVALGEWRDYGISNLRESAVVSIFRRSGENPQFRVEMRPKLREKQGLYAVIGIDGRVLRRGDDLAAVLRVLERALIRAVD